MKVLWITKDVLPSFYTYIEGRPTLGGTWVEPLYLQLNKNLGIEFGILTPVIGGIDQKIVKGNTTYYIIPQKNKYLSIEKLFSFYLKQINDFCPDIIHIHGTENDFALITKYLTSSIPVVCSIQGIITSHIPFLISSVSNIKINYFKSLKNWIFYGGVSGYLNKWNKYSKIEMEIFKINKFFIGRTNWDRAHLNKLNPNAHYFHGEELLRKPFYETDWDIKTCKRESIFFSSASYSLKGFHVLLNAISILRLKYPNISVNVPLSNIKNKLTLRDMFFGEDYSIYLGHLIRKFNLENNVNFFNRLNSREMAEQYKSNHIFVIASFAENSPNSLGEAMIVGCPTVTSFVGGIGSIVKDEESSLFFPSGDCNLLAHQIDRIFSNDILAVNLSVNAKKIANERHDLNKVGLQYFNIYKSIISLN